MIAIGTVLHETYRIDAELGRGGMGRVYSAQHTRLPRRVAVKVLRETTDAQALMRFRREAEICSQIGHGNIVQVYDFNELDGQPYIVMELLAGESLRQRLDRQPVLPRPLLVQMVREIGKALAAAHAVGVVHRDLKPANLFLCAENEHFKVLDFGISKIMGSMTLQTQEDAILGTPGYMPPEQAKGELEHVTAVADQFSLGAIVYEALAGKPAFVSPGDTPYTVLYKILSKDPPPLVNESAEVRALVTRALAKDPAARFADIGAMTTALARALEQPVTAKAAPRRRARGLVAAALALAAAGGAAAVATRAWRTRAPATPTSAPPPPISPPTVAPPPTTVPPPTIAPLATTNALPPPPPPTVVAPDLGVPRASGKRHAPHPPAPPATGDDELSNPYVPPR